MVQAAEVPGYTGNGKGGPQQKSNTDGPLLASCLGKQNPDDYFSAEYASDEFSSSSVAIDSDVTKYNSTKAVDIDRSLVTDPTKLVACFKKAALSSTGGLPAGTTIDAIEFIKPAATLPSNILGEISARLSVSSSGQTQTLYIEDVLIVGKSSDESLTVLGNGAPAAPALIQKLATALAKRIANV